MIRWNNDYNKGSHPEILKALQDYNDTSYGGYGLDEWCEKASNAIKNTIKKTNADIHFVVGGTQANYISIASILRPYQSVISVVSGHINTHETGAVENVGHKVLPCKGINGKITPAEIYTIASEYYDSDIQEHITQPKMVYISYPTEYGTIYSKQELLDIRKACDKYDLYLFIDGARLGYGLGSSMADVTIEDIANIADMFYIGGTKCGALFGEAIVILNDELKPHFRSSMKQNGSLLAKGWLLGLQFYTLFSDDLYFKITGHATELALKIKAAFEAKNLYGHFESFTNQQFVILSESQMNYLAQNHIFEYDSKVDDTHHLVRFCTSWSTKDEDVEALINDINNMQ